MLSRIFLQALLGLLFLVFNHAALIVAHNYGWFPEEQLARLLMNWVGVLQIELVRWVILLVATAIMWGVADYFLYRRHLRTARKPDASPPHGSEDKTPVGTVVTQYLPSTAPAILLKDGWILNYNPEVLTGRKIISFNPEGKIGEGRNRNEYTWSMVGSELEIRRQNGDLQNRFRFDPLSNKFISTNHPDAKGIRDQFIFPDRAHRSK